MASRMSIWMVVGFLALLGIGVWAADLGIRPVVGITMVKGNQVKFVLKGTVGDKVGLKQGDLVVAINGKKITGVDELRAFMMTVKSGAKLTIEYTRDGQEITRTAPFVAPRSPFKAYNIQDGTGLPGDVVVGWSEDRVSHAMDDESEEGDLEDYEDYPGRWSHGKGKKEVVEAGSLGVTAGLVDGKIEFIEFYYPMVARTARGVLTNGKAHDVEKAYGPPESTDKHGGTVWLHYPSRGMSFMVNKDNISKIVVYSPKK